MTNLKTLMPRTTTNVRFRRSIHFPILSRRMRSADLIFYMIKYVDHEISFVKKFIFSERINTSWLNKSEFSEFMKLIWHSAEEICYKIQTCPAGGIFVFNIECTKAKNAKTRLLLRGYPNLNEGKQCTFCEAFSPIAVVWDRLADIGDFWGILQTIYG